MCDSKQKTSVTVLLTAGLYANTYTNKFFGACLVYKKTTLKCAEKT